MEGLCPVLKERGEGGRGGYVVVRGLYYTAATHVHLIYYRIVVVSIQCS